MDYSMLTPRQHRVSKHLTHITIRHVDLAGEKCSICLKPFLSKPSTLEEIESEPLVRTRCGHIFGKACILDWLKYSDHCPYCRTKLPGSEPLDLDQWRAERESFIERIDAMVRNEPDRRLPGCNWKNDNGVLSEKPPKWLRALRLKGFLLEETSADKIPTEPMQQFILHFASNPAKMTNYDMFMTIHVWMVSMDIQALGPDYISNVGDLCDAVTSNLDLHGVRPRPSHEDGDENSTS